MMSAQEFNTRPCESTIDWLKFKPFRLNAIVDRPKAVNQIPTTGHAARKKCSERELLKLAYWKISLPKYPWAKAVNGLRTYPLEITSKIGLTLLTLWLNPKPSWVLHLASNLTHVRPSSL